MAAAIVRRRGTGSPDPRQSQMDPKNAPLIRRALVGTVPSTGPTFHLGIIRVWGVALSRWNHVRYTRDADALLAIDEHRFDDVVRPDDLIVIKLLAGRFIERADAAIMLRENRHEIEFSRLHRAVARQGLTADYHEIWQAAFPDEPVPDLVVPE
jgi:hypothetical protein